MNDLNEANIAAIVQQTIDENEAALQDLQNKNTITIQDIRTFYENSLNRLKNIWQATHADEPAQNGGKTSWDGIMEDLNYAQQVDVGENNILALSAALGAIADTMYSNTLLNEQAYAKLSDQFTKFMELGAGDNVELPAGGLGIDIDNDKLSDLIGMMSLMSMMENQKGKS